ncbi:MAG TPA: ATP-binding protein [Bacillota bacterium]
MRSIQSKIVLIFSILILITMQFIGAFLLRSLQAYFLTEQEQRLTYEVQVLATEAAPLLGQPAGDGDGGGQGDDEDAATAGYAAIQDLIQQRVLPGQVIVADTAGVVIAASDPTRTGSRLLQEAQVLFRVLDTGRVESFTRVDAETGRTLLSVAAPVISDDGRAMAVALLEGELDVIQDTLEAVRRILFTATVVALGAALLLAALTARTITGPIRAVTARAAQMASGDFDQRIEVRSRDELGQLADMFNLLAGRLKETLAEMSDEKRKIETIVTHMADGVVAFDRKRRILLVNPAAVEMLGPPAGARDGSPGGAANGSRAGAPGAAGNGLAAALGLTPSEAWPDLALDKPLEDALSGGRTYEARPFVIRRGERTFQTYFAPIAGSEPPGAVAQAAGAVWVLHDVTQREQVEALRREFVANVSHELRTPLTTIKSYVETLLEYGPDDPDTQRRFLQVVNGETDRMVRLVRDLLDLSQLEFQSVRYEREFCHLSELARQVLAKLQAEIQGKALRASIELPNGEEPLVYVDPDRLQQVLVNIVSNAVEFTPRGGAVTLRIIPGERQVRVEVQDTGPGIPAEDLPHIFERFYRVDKARTRRLGGTGLGLSIARQIVEGHGGQIGIRSEPQKGTLVWFTVPLEPGAGVPA